MAENKRQSSGAKGSRGSSGNATGPNMATDMASLETALSGAMGARIRVTVGPPISTTYEGMLVAADPISSIVIINTRPPPSTADSKEAWNGDHQMFPMSKVQSFQLLSLHPSASNPTDTPFTGAWPPIFPLDIRALKAREAKAVAEAQEREARRGKGVTREAQELFDAFGRTMPTRWSGSNIIVADAVTIAPPYRVDDCRPLVENDTAALARVRKVLEMERKKIELRNASATIGSTSTFARNSGDQRKGG
ncbi:hypothetical protein N7532_008647 [Penicillium argentinense]|uniref:AD domain-containing protein n=1 Tax=Penicillium argentinense TaxID=1131581 RepID=A0A9W9EXR7_9EURO|nr:uncharacterized protein N7532_008647 [Penicillium argentinense]KAJ5089963.1 hypothetical protein N7532_008647 [Penicillium argentinense]